VKDVFIEPVRKSGRTSVAVIVRDVNREMSLNGNYKNICETLRKPDILELAKVKEIKFINEYICIRLVIQCG